MSTHIVTQIKKQVDEAKQRQYTNAKQKKQLKYYSLYIKNIVRIQRYFRSYLVRKTKLLQVQIARELDRKQALYLQQQKLNASIEQAKQRRQQLRYANINKMIEGQKQNITSNVQQIIKNVVSTADKYAKNSAFSKITMEEYKKSQRSEKQLKAQIKQLQLQKQCYEQRIVSWQLKLRQIRQKIIQESNNRKQLMEELESVN